MAPLRRIAGHARPDPTTSRWASAAVTLRQLGPPLAAKLIVERLRLVGKLQRSAPDLVRALLTSSGVGWRALVLVDLAHTHTVLANKLGPLPDPWDGDHAWSDFVTACPGPWAMLLRLYLRRAASGPGRPCRPGKLRPLPTTACAACDAWVPRAHAAHAACDISYMPPATPRPARPAVRRRLGRLHAHVSAPVPRCGAALPRCGGLALPPAPAARGCARRQRCSGFHAAHAAPALASAGAPRRLAL